MISPKNVIETFKEKTANEIYESLCNDKKSDIHEHLPILKQYAETFKIVTEFGVRKGNSTFGFLAGIPIKLTSYDINPCPNIELLEKIASDNKIVFNFIQKSSLLVEIEETNVLFIDSLHTYGQLKKELELHSKKVKNHIILHDTELFAINGERNLEKGFNDAINEFLKENIWKKKQHFANNNGLTIFERI
jgi:hypothetical protein